VDPSLTHDPTRALSLDKPTRSHNTQETLRETKRAAKEYGQPFSEKHKGVALLAKSGSYTRTTTERAMVDVGEEISGRRSCHYTEFENVLLAQIGVVDYAGSSCVDARFSVMKTGLAR